MALESVGGLAMYEILCKLDSTDAASVGCVSRQFHAWVSDDDYLWAHFCSTDLSLQSPLDPLGNPATSFKDAYRAWRDAFHMYPWSLVIRVKRCWDRLRTWLAANYPEVLPTLRQGASEDEIQAFEETMDVKLPLPTRVLYRFCDGQDLTDNESEVDDMLVGLIGGYSFYDHLVNVSLLPLHKIVEETRALMPGNTLKWLVVASSSMYTEKNFTLDCTDGQLFVDLWDRNVFPCVPESLVSSVHDSKGSPIQDGVLLWLEEHVRRLESGIVIVRKEGGMKWINLFPEQPPMCCTAVTNGVKVRASSVFVPEASNFQAEDFRMVFAYSIRMSVLPEGCIVNGMKFGSCQLSQRHWVIHANDAVVDIVNGEGVIGEYPLLCPGDEEYVYQSCVSLSHYPIPGCVEGSFTFIPGRLLNPKGAPFQAEVARFPLEWTPDYIF